jgi:hypoxanthine phosphoribosyltransferase
MVSKADAIQVHGLQYLLENLSAHHSLLIVDDVFSTGSSVAAVITQLALRTRRNLPGDIRVASVWYRPTEKTLRVPDYFVHETRDWLVLPYELTGFSIEELRQHRPELRQIIDRLEPFVQKRKNQPAA